MKQKIKKLVRIIVGILLIAIGIAGLFLPVLQGILLIAAGLVFLEYEPMTKLVHSIKERMAEKWKRWKAGKS